MEGCFNVFDYNMTVSQNSIFLRRNSSICQPTFLLKSKHSLQVLSFLGKTEKETGYLHSDIFKHCYHFLQVTILIFKNVLIAAISFCPVIVLQSLVPESNCDKAFRPPKPRQLIYHSLKLDEVEGIYNVFVISIHQKQ